MVHKLHIALLTFFSFLSSSALAQTTMLQALSEIEHNNTTLAALRQTADAEKLENKTDIFLSNPEMGFNYLWGNPSAIGSRKDYSISQPLDIATLSGSKNRLADRKNDAVEYQYLADRMTIMLEAKQLLVDLTYYNILLAEQQKRVADAERQLLAQKRRLDAGDGNKLEYNNMRLATQTLKADVTQTESDRAVVLSALARLNGGISLTYNPLAYETTSLPLSFADWYAAEEQKNPLLAYVRSQIDVSKQQLDLNKKQGLPSLSVGYMGEKTMGELYHGISLSLSLPLWSNRNRIKQARASIVAAEKRDADAKQQFYGQLQTLYQRAVGLKATAEALRRALAESDNKQLLNKALEAGEISLIDYLSQLTLYYDAQDKAMKADHEFQRALADLHQSEL